MENIAFEYYVVSISNEESAPLLDEQDSSPKYFYYEGEVENPELMKFQLGDPVPRKPKMVDYHSSPNSVVSGKIFNVLKPLKIKGIQLIPAIVTDKKRGIDYDDYWAIHIFNEIECVDENLSICEINGISLSDVEKIVLNKEVLLKFPLEDRLIFRLAEDTSYQLFHKSIVDAIMSVNPIGISFYSIDEYNEDILFE